jgi:hypothetical protein
MKIWLVDKSSKEMVSAQAFFFFSHDELRYIFRDSTRTYLDPTEVERIERNSHFVAFRQSMKSEDHRMQPTEVIRRKSQDCLVDFFQSESVYAAIPNLDVISLPRGGVSLATSALGWIQVRLILPFQLVFVPLYNLLNYSSRSLGQFGIPPETIKDSIRLGLDVPSIYIVPIERFCRETGATLGINVAEVEFPAYYNFFLRKRQCTLIVHSDEAEDSIRRVFGETLLGPAQFRREESPITFEEEDFSPDFDRDAIPNFQKELQHFRTMPDGKELTIETLLNFVHFERRYLSAGHGQSPKSESKASINLG